MGLFTGACYIVLKAHCFLKRQLARGEEGRCQFLPGEVWEGESISGMKGGSSVPQGNWEVSHHLHGKERASIFRNGPAS